MDDSAQHLPTHPFWQFSLEIYGQRTVQETLLTLQNQYHLYVNLLLYCCWHAKMGYGRLNLSQIKELLGIIGQWEQSVVMSLRKIRKNFKAQAAVNAKVACLRKAVKTLELDSEHVEQLMLAEWLLTCPNPLKTITQQMKDAMQNLEAYFKHKRIPIDHQIQQCLVALLMATFPAMPHEQMSALIGRPLETLNVLPVEEQKNLF